MEAAGIEIIPGTSAPSGLGMAVAQAFIASTRRISRGIHGSPLDILVEDVVDNPIPPGATRIKLSDKPGLGVSLNEKVITKYRVD
jgi:L-alanine-DL-glutamate epimerase-like enolase superfamily enzyme